MIGTKFCKLMARYNRWQHTSLTGAADTLDDAERTRDHGAFFGSIQGTLNHLLWGDTIWMSRFDGWRIPKTSIPDGTRLTASWAAYKAARADADARIIGWTDRLTGSELQGEMVWYSGALDANFQKPKWLCVQGFFNHQTHHRGQVHCLLTAAGAVPDDTDLVFMPEDA